MQNRMALPNVAQEHVAQALALARTLHQTGDVDNFYRGRHDALRIDNGFQRLEAWIWDIHRPNVGLNGAKREIGRLGFRIAQAIEQRGFAHIGKTDDTALHIPGISGKGSP